MYVGTNFTSDLMNSYTWDTTIDFLQKCDDREGENKTPYSRQTSLYGGMAEKGTIGTDKEDKICNIYDMAMNCYEWSTEISSNGESLCVDRGGAIMMTIILHLLDMEKEYQLVIYIMQVLLSVQFYIYNFKGKVNIFPLKFIKTVVKTIDK